MRSKRSKAWHRRKVLEEVLRALGDPGAAQRAFDKWWVMQAPKLVPPAVPGAEVNIDEVLADGTVKGTVKLRPAYTLDYIELPLRTKDGT